MSRASGWKTADGHRVAIWEDQAPGQDPTNPRAGVYRWSVHSRDGARKLAESAGSLTRYSDARAAAMKALPRLREKLIEADPIPEVPA